MNRPTLVLLVGIPGSGKTTYAEKYILEHTNTIHLSSDKIRKELWGDESIQGDNNEVFSLMQTSAVEALNNGTSVVYDATNVTRKDRSYIISLCPKFAKIEAHIIWAPIEICIARDAARQRTVDEAVIVKMIKRFQAPYYDEGIHDIKTILPSGFDAKSYKTQVCCSMQIPHDNPHHTLDVSSHCISAYDYLCNNMGIEDNDVNLAAYYHDVGKPYVKSFRDSKGNRCDIAHYYQHQCVGSWMSYGLPYVNPTVAWLISTHMDPFMNTKYYNKLPSFLKDSIDLLHKADVAAH